MPGNIVGEAWVAIRPDLSGFESDLMTKVGASLEKVQALADAKPVTLRVNLDTTQAMAQLAALRAAAGAAVGGGSGGGFTGGAIGAAAAPGGGNGSNAFGGLLTGAALTKLIGFGPGGGTGVTIPWIGVTMAGAFSLASFAGLGLEHVLFTILGLVGSLAGAIGGGLLLALGALGVALVGMGSDLAVMKSVIADTSTLYKQLEVIRRAQIQYGVNSPQAASAKAILGVDMKMLGNTAGVAAELALAKSVQALNIYWDKMTSNARVAAVSILQQFVTLGHDFVPLVANAATRNFDIITVAIKPLLAWLEGPNGMGIFNHLENVFAHNLPTAIHAFSQAIEFVLKTLNYLADFTGGFTKKMDAFFTYANSPAGFAKWQHMMDTLIGMFHVWFAFFSILLRDIVDLFKLTAGLGTGIVGTLTQMLTKLHTWLNLTTTKSSLHSLFELHKQEVLAILQLLPPVLKGLSDIYLTVAPPLTKALTVVLAVIVKILGATVSNPFGAWLVGIGLILAKLGLLGGVLSTLKGGIAGFFGIGGGAGGASGGIAQLSGALGQRVFVTNWPPGFGGGTTAYDDWLMGGGKGALPAAAADTGVLAAGGLGAAGAGETSVLEGILASGTVTTAIAAAAPAAALAVIAYFGWQSILKENQKPAAEQAKDAKAVRDSILGNMAQHAPKDAFNLGLYPTAAKAIQVSAAQAKTDWNDLVLLASGGKRMWNQFFTSMGADLKTTLQHGSNIAVAENDMYTLFKAGKLKNATAVQAWENSWNQIQVSTGKNATFAEGLATSMEAAGKLTYKNVPQFITAFNALVKDGMNPASITAIDIANELLLAKATAANLNQTLDTINSAADLFAKTNRLTLPHGGAPTGPGAGKGKPPVTVHQTNHFHGTNPQETDAAIQANNRRLLVALRGL